MNYRTKESLYPFAEILDTAVSGFILRNFKTAEVENQVQFEAHLKPVYQFVKDPFELWKYYKTLYFMKALNNNEISLIRSLANRNPEDLIDTLICDSLVEAAESVLAGYDEIHSFEIKKKVCKVPNSILNQIPADEKSACPKPQIPKEIKELLQNK